MKLTRRRVIAGTIGGLVTTVGGAGAWHAFGGNSQAPEPVENPPPEVEAVQPLAEAFYRRIRQHYPEARVFITQNAEIALDYPTAQESEEGLRTEINQIADLFAKVVEEGYDPTTLFITTGEVQAIVPEATVQAYVNREIYRDGFLKTIEVTDVERRDS